MGGLKGEGLFERDIGVTQVYMGCTAFGFPKIRWEYPGSQLDVGNTHALGTLQDIGYTSASNLFASFGQ